MFSDAVEESRKHDEHRKFVIAGSALAAYVGLWDLVHREVVDFLTQIGRG